MADTFLKKEVKNLAKKLSLCDAARWDDAVILIAKLKLLLDLDNRSIAQALGVSGPALTRWAAGTHYPHPFVRAERLESLRQFAEEQAEELPEQEASWIAYPRQKTNDKQPLIFDTSSQHNKG